MKSLRKLSKNSVAAPGARHLQLLGLVWLLSVCSPSVAQKTDKLLVNLLRKSPELFGPMLKNPAQYDVQILYTQINRDAQNQPTFKTYRYRVDKNRYFYPASTVKLPAVLLSLEKLNELKKAGKSVGRDTPLLTDSAFVGQTSVQRDTSAQNGLPSVGHYAKKILLVSDNDAFNRLYEFMGQCAINERLNAKGYRNLRIVHRLSVPLMAEQNRRTNPVRLTNDGQTLVSQPEQICDKTPRSDSLIRRGIGYMKGDSLVKQPFDFTEKNYFALEDQQAMLRAVLFPDAVPARQRFDLTPDDYQFLYQYLSQVPRETTYPRYDSTFYDSYCKFLLAGDSKRMFPRNLRIFNKVGDAYGYLIDNAYITDFDTGVEFLLSAVIYCNKDGIFNDDAYDYDTVGFPFMGNLGRVIFDYESRRKRPYKPNFSSFRVKYDK
ncbi:MAG: serine hydrolase [Bacteroidetes bacterium]|nr:serine hydrolase [Fibrella sp.]